MAGEQKEREEVSEKIIARKTAQHNGGDRGRSTRMGVTAGLSSARARMDERNMTCTKDRKHAIAAE